MRAYEDIISAATGVTDSAVLAAIEDQMRHTIFHSTLDWQTRAQLAKGAREAYGLVRVMLRGASPVILPEDEETARLLGVGAHEVPALAKEIS